MYKLHWLVENNLLLFSPRPPCCAVVQAKSLARTLADTHIVEQRLKDMRLLHQRIEDQNKQLRLILALHKSILDAQQATRQYEGSCSKGEKDISP